MSILEFISKQPVERQELLLTLHKTILQKDTSVSAVIGPMMGKEMIYNASGSFKYGLASVQKYMSLHVLPLYVVPTLFEKYQDLLPHATFQKGCINFKNKAEMPVTIIRDLIADCAIVDLRKIRENQLKSKIEKKIKSV